MFHDASPSDIIVVNGAGPVGLTFAIALLDRATQLGLSKPHVQIWDPHVTPWRETVIRLPHSIAVSLPEEVQMELWEETVALPRRLFVPGPCEFSIATENSRVHDPYSQPPCRYTPIVQIKQFQEVTLKYLLAHHPQSCTIHNSQCPPEVMRGASAVIQSYGKTARKANPIGGNCVSQEHPILDDLDMDAPSEHGLFLLFERTDVVEGDRDADHQLFNQRGNGFTVFQSHKLTNAVQVYIWPEDATNDIGHPSVPTTQDDLIQNGKAFGLRALFDCVPHLQGAEKWWWELSRRCRLQGENGRPVPRESRCTLDWRSGRPGSQQHPRIGEKACSPAFEAWFDAVRYQISLNMFKMGIFGTHAENFLHKVHLCYARREPYRYNNVYTEVEGVPVIYLGDSAGSTDFKKGLSCGRGLLCASQLAFDSLDSVVRQLQSTGRVNLKSAVHYGAERYQAQWKSTEMVSEWRYDFDATYKYLQVGRWPAAPKLQDFQDFQENMLDSATVFQPQVIMVGA